MFSPKATIGTNSVWLAALAAAVTVAVTVCAPPLKGAVVAGENVRLTPSTPGLLNVTGPLNPFTGATCVVNVTECPACRLSGVAGFTVKSGSVAAVTVKNTV
jgi:hypothetical protein